MEQVYRVSAKSKDLGVRDRLFQSQFNLYKMCDLGKAIKISVIWFLYPNYMDNKHFLECILIILNKVMTELLLSTRHVINFY